MCTVVFFSYSSDRTMATPVARDASRRAVEQGEKEAPLAMLLILSLVPSLSRSAALPLSFFPATAPNPNRARRRHCRSSEPPQTNRRHQKRRLEVLNRLTEPRVRGCCLRVAIDVLPQYHHRDTDRNTSPIPAVSGRPLRHRAHEHLRGEHAFLTDPFSLPAVLASRRNGRLFVVGSPRPPSPLFRRLPSLR